MEEQRPEEYVPQSPAQPENQGVDEPEGQAKQLEIQKYFVRDLEFVVHQLGQINTVIKELHDLYTIKLFHQRVRQCTLEGLDIPLSIVPDAVRDVWCSDKNKK